MADIRIQRTCKLKEQKPNPDRRENIGGLLTQFSKFAIDSTINFPLKAFSGRKQAYEIVQERLKDRPVSISLDDKKIPEDLKLVKEEMEAKMEKMQEDMNIVKQQHKISTKHVEESEHLKKKPDEVVVQQNNRKKIFIRSRL